MHKDEKLQLWIYGVVTIALWALMFVPPYTWHTAITGALVASASTASWWLMYRTIKRRIVDRVLRRLERGEQ